MADLTGTYVANNYMVALAPFSQFGTRRLAIFTVELDYDIESEYDPDDVVNSWESGDPAPSVPNSVFMQALRGVQLKAEIYMVGQPADTNFFVVVIAEDTGVTSWDDMNDSSQRLADAIYDATGGIDCWVERKRFRGDHLGNMSDEFSLVVGASKNKPGAVSKMVK